MITGSDEFLLSAFFSNLAFSFNSCDHHLSKIALHNISYLLMINLINYNGAERAYKYDRNTTITLQCYDNQPHFCPFLLPFSPHITLSIQQ